MYTISECFMFYETHGKQIWQHANAGMSEAKLVVRLYDAFVNTLKYEFAEQLGEAIKQYQLRRSR